MSESVAVAAQNNLKKVDYDPFAEGTITVAATTTQSQREIWASLEMDENSTLCYNECLIVELLGVVDIKSFNRAFELIVGKHDSLRSVFSSDGKSFMVQDKLFPVIFEDFSVDGNSEARLKELCEKEVATSFDLVRGPCYRSRLVKLQQNRFAFILTAHHIICDGWSFAVLLSELGGAYRSFCSNLVPELGSARNFYEYAQQESRDGENGDHKKYWLNEFRQEIDVNTFPTDFERPRFRTFESSRLDMKVPDELVSRLKQLGTANGCSFYSTLMTVFNLFLFKLTGSKDIVVGMACASQPNLDQNDLVGHMVNLLPLRTRPTGEVSFISYLKSTRTKMLDAFDHYEFGFGSLVKSLTHIKRDPSEIPLLNVVFNIDQQSPGQGLDFGVPAFFSTHPRSFENFEIFVNAVSLEESLGLEVQYNTNLFKKETIENWIGSFIRLAEEVLENPGRHLASIPLAGLQIPTATLSQKVEPVNASRDLDTEERIRRIWSKVLLNDQIDSEENFFSIGGHSLLAIEAAALLKDELGVALTIKDIFEAPTIRELAQRLSSRQGSTSANEDLTSLLKVDGTLKKGKVSYNQMQVWYLEEMHPKTRMHNLPSTIRVPFKIDPKVLEKTIHYVFRRHPALRTGIVVENGAPVQKVFDPDLPSMRPVISPIKVKLSEIMGLLNKEIDDTFDISCPPLCKIKLYDFENHESAIFFMVHHSVWDGWSFDIFLDELDIIYTAFLNGKEPILPREPKVSYLDYTLWLDGLIESGKLDKEVAYWQKKLEGPLPVMELPLDFRRPAVMSHDGRHLRFLLGEQEARKLKEYARHQGTSLYNVFLTAFKITLARASSVNDVIVGTPIRGRNHPDVLQTIGYFVSTVALRTTIDLSRSFEENLKNVTKTSAESFDNQMTPFQIILNKVKFTKDPSRSPIFQTLFSYQDVNNRPEQLLGIPFTRFPINKNSTHTDIDLWVKSKDDKIEGGIEYNPDLFMEESIKRFNDCFFYLLYNLSFNQSRPLCTLPSVPESHQNIIVHKWNNTWVKQEGFLPLNKVFEENSRLYPDHIAIESKSGSLTYQELDRLSNRLAHGLIQRGVGRGELVGISLTRDANLLVALLGVLKTGAGYVPLDPGFPQERLDYMLESSRPRLLLTESSLLSRFNEQSNKVTLSNVISDSTISDRPVKVEQDFNDTIYVIYTSGSTGHPKGVQLTHRSVTNFLLSMKKSPGLMSKDRLLAVTTLSFDIAVLELFLPLFTGATVVLASGEEVVDGTALKGILESKNITMMQATPSTWRLLLASGWKGDHKLKVLCGGEAFPKDLAQKLLPITREVWNMYGPTETTVWSSCKKLSPNDETITLGTAIDNTCLYVLDENHHHVPIGAVGELYIGGMGLAHGYFNRTDLTEERFVPNPYRPGERMYATGDSARFTSQGEVECLGRKDGQVKVRGYRIELGEIEAELLKISEIEEAAVNVCEYRPGDFRIVAYVLNRKGMQFNQREIRTALSKRLPAYMIPSNFLEVDSIPKTLNGKVDKKRLPKLKGDGIEPESPVKKGVITTEASSLSSTLKHIWKEVLGLSDINETDDFFSIGGNSLLAVRLFSMLAEKYKLNLPLSLLLGASNFKEFVESVSKHLPEYNDVLPSSKMNVPQIFKALVSIKSQGRRNALFCFHGVGGNVLNYVSLAAVTKDERPLLALQALGLDGRAQLPSSIEEMATEYIKEIKLVQPEGPYLLAGGSMGGMIALEVAIQLTRLGDKIDKVIMFDTFGPEINIKNFSKHGPMSRLKTLKFSLHYKIRVMTNAIRCKLHRILGLPVPLENLLFNIEWNNYKALWKYRPQKYGGDLHIIRSRVTESGWYSDPLMGWATTIGGEIKTYEINGTHSDFMEAPELCPTLRQLL